MSSTWIETSGTQPCKICKGAGWCRTNADESIAICRRGIEHPQFGRGKEKKDKNGEPYFVYVTGPRPAKGIPTTRHHSEGAKQRATADELDLVYRALLSSLPKSHSKLSEDLDRRGVPGDSPLRNQLRWMSLKGRSAIAGKLVVAGHEPLMARTPGFVVKHGNGGSQYWTIAGPPGIWIPVHDAKNRVVAIVIRSECPKPGKKYVHLSSSHCGGGKACHCTHVPMGFEGATPMVRVTEGVFKANVAVALDPKTLTIGLPGLHARDLVKTLKRLKVKTVRLALDADAGRNLAVAKAIQAHFRRLSQAFAVELEVWSEADGKGIDDLLAAGKRPVVLTGEAASDAIAAMIQSAEEKAHGGRLVVQVTENESEVVLAVIGALAKNDRIFCRDTSLVTRPSTGWSS